MGYLATAKWIAGLLMASLLFVGGWQFAKGRSAKEIGRLQTSLQAAADALGNAKTALNSVSEATRADKARADQWMRAGQEAAKQATKDAQIYQKRYMQIQSDIERAKRVPSCKVQLEGVVCVTLK